jgi:hypothetical protein
MLHKLSIFVIRKYKWSNNRQMSVLTLYILHLVIRWAIGWFRIIVAGCGSCVRGFVWQLIGWGGVVICMTFHKRAFDFFDIITHWFDSFQNCATMNCQRNINSTLPTQLPHTFSCMVAILGHNHFESPNM